MIITERFPARATLDAAPTPPVPPSHPLWMSAALRLAAAERMLVAFAIVALPALGHQAWTSTLSGNPEFLRLIAALIAASAIGLAVAARDPVRHWPVVLIVTLESLYVLIAALVAGLDRGGSVDALVGLLHGAVWLGPFCVILWRAWRRSQGLARIHDADVPPVSELLRLTRTNDGDTLAALSREQPVMLVFLRHFGCTFCRETLADIVNRRHEISARNTGIVLVHMAADVDAKAFLSHYGLEDLPRVSDPEQRLYRAFDLDRGTFWQLLGPRVWWRALTAGILRGHGVGKLLGDGFQMPGAFVIFHGDVIRTFRHRSVADRPDYLEVACSLRGDDPVAA